MFIGFQLFALGIPPNAYVHAVALIVVERRGRRVGVVAALSIRVAYLLDKLSLSRTDAGIIALLNRGELRIAGAAELAPSLEAVGIEGNPLLRDDLLQLSLLRIACVPSHVTGGDVGLIVGGGAILKHAGADDGFSILIDDQTGDRALLLSS